MHPRLRLGHFRYGYSRLDANEREIRTGQIPGYDPFRFPRFLGRGSFLSPGRALSDMGRRVCPRHPHTTFFKIVFIEYDFRLRFPISVRLRRSSFSHGHHSGKCPRRNTRALPQLARLRASLPTRACTRESLPEIKFENTKPRVRFFRLV